MRVEINFNICRICLQNTDEDMSLIYEPTHEKEGVPVELLYQKIERCGGIEVLTNPELPNKICKKCKVFLNIAHKFRTICKSSDEYLREFMLQSSELFEPMDAVGEEYVDGVAEYLLEFNPEMAGTTVAHVLQQAGHEIDESQTAFNYEEIDQYTEMWVNENDNTNNSNTNSPLKDIKPLEMHKLRRSSLSRKTLDISSDGAAVIRVKHQHMLKPEKQIHICDVCGNTYNRKYALDAHMRRHRNEKPFECEICQKAFHLNFQLTRHIRKHTGARPYTCQYCNRNFSDRSTMVKHERIHRNERPYTCETCGKSFTYSNVLKVHMLTHTGEKPFICDLCGKRFSRAHHLRAHLETLQHQSDPRSKVLVTQIKREVDRFHDE